MRTPKDRYKTFIFALILLAAGLVMMIPFAKAEVDANKVDQINKDLDDAVDRHNEVSLKHFSVKTMHYLMITTDGAIVINLVSEAIAYGRGTKEQQIGYMLDNILMDEITLKKMGIYRIRVLIDGELYKEVEL